MVQFKLYKKLIKSMFIYNLNVDLIINECYNKFIKKIKKIKE